MPLLADTFILPTVLYKGGDGGMEYGMCTMILGEARSLEKFIRIDDS